MESRQAVFHDGIVIDGVVIPVQEADSTVRFVHLHHCPFKVPNETVGKALSAFGTVLDSQFSCFADSTVRNGSRVAKMSLRDEIPTKLFVLRYPCRVWYRGQVQVCNICRRSEHRAASCPFHDVCLKCRQSGHFARDCPGVSADVPAPAVDVVPAPVPDVTSSAEPTPAVPRLSLEAVRSLLRNAAAVADFDQPLVSPDVASSILARGAARRRPAADVVGNATLSSAGVESSVPVSVLSRGPFVVCHPDPALPGNYLLFDFHSLTRQVVVEDSATFEMYRECYYEDNRGPFPVKTVFLPGCPVSTPVVHLDPNVSPVSFLSQV